VDFPVFVAEICLPKRRIFFSSRQFYSRSNREIKAKPTIATADIQKGKLSGVPFYRGILADCPGPINTVSS
jgi:hypothetical protein